MTFFLFKRFQMASRLQYSIASVFTKRERHLITSVTGTNAEHTGANLLPCSLHAFEQAAKGRWDMSNQERVRILCVEDHPLMRAGIAVIINGQADMELVAQASTGHEAIKCFDEYEPDVTLMDLALSDMSGIDAMIAIHARFPKARVIISSTFPSAVQIKRAMASGARSYILKNMSPIEVAASIHKVHAGKTHIPMELATYLAEHLGEEALSEREIEVLRHVSTGNSNKTIADVLNLSEHTVKGHLKNILFKLGANDRTHAVMIALQRRLLLI
jgi:DNA-binding NarL/FixJ family response regulator